MPLYYPDISWYILIMSLLYSLDSQSLVLWWPRGDLRTCGMTLGISGPRKHSETIGNHVQNLKHCAIQIDIPWIKWLNLSPSLLPLGSAAFEASCPYSMGLGNDHTSTCWPCWTGGGVRKMNDWTPFVPALVIKHCFFGHCSPALATLLMLSTTRAALAHCNKHEAWRCDWASEFSRPEGQELTSLFSVGASQSFYILNQIWIKSYWVAAYLECPGLRTAASLSIPWKLSTTDSCQAELVHVTLVVMKPRSASSCCKTSTIWSQSCSGFQTVLGESNSEVGECCTSEFRILLQHSASETGNVRGARFYSTCLEHPILSQAVLKGSQCVLIRLYLSSVCLPYFWASGL